MERDVAALEKSKLEAGKVESLKAKGQRGQLALLLVAGGMFLVPR